MPSDTSISGLSDSQRATILKLGTQCSNGAHDQIAMRELFAMGIIEVSKDHRVVLTARGQLIYMHLAEGHGG
jgi:hypothetical protein